MSDTGRRRLVQGLVAAGLLPASLAPAAAAASHAPGQDDAPDHQAWTVAALEDRRRDSGRPWLPFFEAPTMRMGLYRLPAGGEDRQQPHDADEAYYVVAGRATLVAGGERYPAAPGSVLFVKAGVEHRFVDIDEDLSVLVFFAAKGSA